MSWQDIEVTKIWRCLDCKAKSISITTAIQEDLKACPNCTSDRILIEDSSCSQSVSIDNNKPKTVGSLAETNTKRFEKEGTLSDKIKQDRGKPKRKKFDKRILNNPTKYIMTGEK